MSSTGFSGKSIDESLDDQRPIRNAAIDGLRVLDANATLTFTLYNRIVLPIDGFVFWVRADVLSPSAVPNTSVPNTFAPNQGQVLVTPAPEFDAPGSLHHSTINQQGDTESFSLQRMVFTSEVPVDQLNEVAPHQMYVADWENLKFAFSTRNAFYKQAGLYHYSGDALYPSVATQLIDFPSQLNSRQIVSNSLPAWLTINKLFPVYPSMLVPGNIVPPYAAIHIGEEDTTAIAAGPTHGPDGSRYQLVKDKVTVTTYGVRNDQIMSYLDQVDEYTVMVGGFGLMNTPVVKDGKRGQVEFSTLAQKKVITFEVDYYQTAMRNIARQLITSAFVTFNLPGVPEPFQSAEILGTLP